MNRFAVLEHTWDGVHWDFLLESGTALATWAIDEPIVVGRLLAARALTDHRLAYLDYEGPVSGGRGSVRRLDSGTYELLAWEADRVVVRLAGTVFRGTAELRSSAPGGTANAVGWTFLLGKVD